MNLLVAVWKGRVSPVFDVSREAILISTEQGESKGKLILFPLNHHMSIKIDYLVKLNTSLLICGAISKQAQHMISAQQIRLLSFIHGNTEDVLNAWRQGNLEGNEKFIMPRKELCKCPLNGTSNKGNFK